MLLQVVFYKYSGYTFIQGMNQLTASATVLTQSNLIVPPNTFQPTIIVGATVANGAAHASGGLGMAHMMLLRHFIG